MKKQHKNKIRASKMGMLCYMQGRSNKIGGSTLILKMAPNKNN